MDCNRKKSQNGLYGYGIPVDFIQYRFIDSSIISAEKGICRRDMLKTICLSIAGLIIGCVGTPKMPLDPLDPKTTKYALQLPDEEIIYNINGLWDATYDFSGLGIGSYNEIIKITQDGRKFYGIKLVGTHWVPKGAKTIRGTLEKNGFRDVFMYFSDSGWDMSRGEITVNGEMITISNMKAIISMRRK